MTESRTASLFSFSALAQDVRFAGRMLVKSPLFSGVVVVTLALGIGLNTAVFSAVEALILRPLPGVERTSDLVQLYRSWPGDLKYGSNSIPHFWDVRARTKDVFSGTAAWSFSDLSVTGSGTPQRVMGQMVSADYFDVLGVRTTRGRTFRPEEDEGRGAHPVAVLSDRGWKGVFGGDPDIIGKEIPVNGQNTMIIGIAPPEFNGTMPMVPPTMWMPLMQLGQIRPGGAGSFDNRGNNFLNVVARLAPGVSFEQSRSRLDAVLAELKTEFPEPYEGSGITTVLQDEAGIHPTMRGAQVGLSAVVMVVVGLLLLIACVNVANLFLARARDRAREMAIRVSLGARRAALIRQMMVESLMFASVAGLVGLLVANWAIAIANQIRIPMDIDFSPDLRISLPVLGGALIATIVTGVLVGLVPAFQATRPALIPALKGEAPAGGGRSRMSRGLVVAQMALSLILLVCAGLFLTNLRSATAVDKGFDGERLLMADIDPGLQGIPRGGTVEFYRRLEERLRAHPDVQEFGMINDLPLGLGTSDRFVEVPGYVPAENEGMSILYASVSPDYFKAMGIPLRDGHAFTAQDDSAGRRVLVVNERFAQRFWAGQSAVGKTVLTRGGTEHTVVGVVPTGKYRRLGEDPEAFMWFPQAQAWEAGMTVILRTRGDPTALVATLRSEIGALDPNLPIRNPRTMDQHLGISLLPARITGITLGVFGALGLLLAAVGMYGVMAYSVAQRTREIGIRMAIGAAARDVVRLIVRQGLTLVLIGTAIGLAGAFAASRLLSGVLYGGNSLDPMTFTLVPLVLIGVATLATFAPARRAARVDPAITLRAD